MRRRLLTAAAFALALSVALLAASTFEQITVANTAIGFTLAKIRPPDTSRQMQWASCRLETAQIRWTKDGTTPTTTVGTPMEVGETLTLFGNDQLRAFLAIRTGGTSGVLNCHFDP